MDQSMGCAVWAPTIPPPVGHLLLQQAADNAIQTGVLITKAGRTAASIRNVLLCKVARQFESASLSHTVLQVPHSPPKRVKSARVRAFVKRRKS
jgi:hypothetical protein